MEHDSLLDQLEAEFQAGMLEGGEFPDLPIPDATIEALLNKQSLKWIFVGGKVRIGSFSALLTQ